MAIASLNQRYTLQCYKSRNWQLSDVEFEKALEMLSGRTLVLTKSYLKSSQVNEPTKLKAIEDYRQHSECLPELLGIRLLDVGEQTLTASLDVTAHHLNPVHSSCHAATIVAPADTACGWGCLAHLPDSAASFTTVEFSCNLLRSVTIGVIKCGATMLPGVETNLGQIDPHPSRLTS